MTLSGGIKALNPNDIGRIEAASAYQSAGIQIVQQNVLNGG
jgi:hypothetical protein